MGGREGERDEGRKRGGKKKKNRKRVGRKGKMEVRRDEGIEGMKKG